MESPQTVELKAILLLLHTFLIKIWINSIFFGIICSKPIIIRTRRVNNINKNKSLLHCRHDTVLILCNRYLSWPEMIYIYLFCSILWFISEYKIPARENLELRHFVSHFCSIFETFVLRLGDRNTVPCFVTRARNNFH